LKVRCDARLGALCGRRENQFAGMLREFASGQAPHDPIAGELAAQAAGRPACNEEEP